MTLEDLDHVANIIEKLSVTLAICATLFVLSCKAFTTMRAARQPSEENERIDDAMDEIIASIGKIRGRRAEVNDSARADNYRVSQVEQIADFIKNREHE